MYFCAFRVQYFSRKGAKLRKVCVVCVWWSHTESTEQHRTLSTYSHVSSRFFLSHECTRIYTNAVRSGIVSRRRRRLSQNNMLSKVSVVFRDFRVDLHQRISVPSLWRVPRRWSGRYRCGCRSRNWRRWWHIPFEGRTWRCRNSRR